MGEIQNPYSTIPGDTEPAIVLFGRDPHAPAALRAIAMKARVTHPEFAATMDKAAVEFDAWRSSHRAVKL